MLVSAGCGEGCPPCEGTPCQPIVICGGVTVPSLWKLTVGAFSGCTGSSTPFINSWASGVFWLATQNRAEYKTSGSQWEPYSSGCSGSSVYIEYPISNTGTLVAGRTYFPIRTDDGKNAPFPNVDAFDLQPNSFSPVWEVEYAPDPGDSASTIVTLTGNTGEFTQATPSDPVVWKYVVYTATVATLDLVTYGTITLSLATNDSTCTPPSTVSLEVAGEALANIVANCTKTCTSLIGAGDYGILRFSGTIGGTYVFLCLADVGFDETLLSKVREGSGTFIFSCGARTVRVRIYCGLLNPEDEERQWLIEFSNTTTLTPEIFALNISAFDPFEAMVSETLENLCGEDVVVAAIDACADPPFADCCTDPDDQAGTCCLGNDATIPYQGIIEESFPGNCAPCTTSAGSWGWNYGNPPTSTGNLWAAPRWYWHGPVGNSDLDSYAKGILSCDGGSWVAEQVVVSTGDFHESGAFTGTACPTPNGTITWGNPTDGCCGGGGGAYKTQLG